MDEKPSVVIEEYLQLIYHLQLKQEPVKAVAITNRMQASPSTVHATLLRMQRDNLIEIQDDKQIKLTDRGLDQASNLALRHNLAEHFLCHTLGIPWYEVHRHAHQLEHAFTPLVVEKLAEFLGFPTHCPHGTPMPNQQPIKNDQRFPLDQAQKGAEVEILLIDESMEDSEELLKHLYDRGILPGTSHLITERIEATHSLTLQSACGKTTLPFDILAKIWCIPVTETPLA